VEETRVPRENHRPFASHWQTLSHNVTIYLNLSTGIPEITLNMYDLTNTVTNLPNNGIHL
jgi:hypothetical protein